MAKIRSGGLVGQISGSIGGNTYGRGKGGPIVRTRRVPTRLSADSHHAARSSLSTRSTAWQSLSAENRRAWHNYAAQHPVSDVFGEARPLSGSQMYVRLNNRLASVGASGIDEPPVTSAPPGLRALFWEYQASPDSILVYAQGDPFPNAYIQIQALVTASRGVSSTRGKERLVYTAPFVGLGPYDIRQGLQAVFGATSSAMKFFIIARLLDADTGLMSGTRLASPLPAENFPMWDSQHVNVTVSASSAGNVEPGDCLRLYDNWAVGTTSEAEHNIVGFARSPGAPGDTITMRVRGLQTAKWSGALPTLYGDFNAAVTDSTPGLCRNASFGGGAGVALAVDSTNSTSTLFLKP